jgi:hypothetical protein
MFVEIVGAYIRRKARLVISLAPKGGHRSLIFTDVNLGVFNMASELSSSGKLKKVPKHLNSVEILKS